MPPNLALATSHKSGSVVAVANARHACPECAPLTDGAAAGTWRGETDAWGLHGGDLAVGLARILLKVFLWADLTQPGGEVHWSKPVRAKSKG